PSHPTLFPYTTLFRSVWEYLACAYGQQHAFRKRDPDIKSTDLKQSRDNALKAIRRAIQIDPAAKEFLREYWRKDATPPENDLARDRKSTRLNSSHRTI